MKRYCRCGRSTGDKAGQCRRQERERKEILARNRGMKPIYNKEEKEDTTIRTRRVTFVETAHTPPPTIPGMVSLGKSGGKNGEEKRRVIDKSGGAYRRESAEEGAGTQAADAGTGGRSGKSKEAAKGRESA